jgi:hypothetical protein
MLQDAEVDLFLVALQKGRVQSSKQVVVITCTPEIIQPHEGLKTLIFVQKEIRYASLRCRLAGLEVPKARKSQTRLAPPIK